MYFYFALHRTDVRYLQLGWKMSVVDPLSLALGQISFAITDLTKKNYKITVTEIHEVTVKFLGPF